MLKDYIILDIDTTGLDKDHDYVNSIIAIKVIDKKIKDIFRVSFGYNFIDKIKLRLIEFTKDLPIITYSYKFIDVFLKLDIDNKIIDITNLSKELYPDLKRHNLSSIASYLNIDYNKDNMNLDNYGFLLNEVYLKINEELLDKEIRNYIINNDNVSISSIQRKFLIGIKRAKRILESVEDIYES